MTMSLSPEPVNMFVILHVKWDFADVMRLQTIK